MFIGKKEKIKGLPKQKNKSRQEIENQQEYDDQSSTQNSSSQISLGSNHSSSNQQQIMQQQQQMTNSGKIQEQLFQILIFEEASEKQKIYSTRDWEEIIVGKPRNKTPYMVLKSSLRAGITRKMRPSIWFWLTDLKINEQKFSANLFERLSQAPSKWDSLIDGDVNRTHYASTKQKAMVFKVCRAYSNFDTEIGYLQGINHVVCGILMSLEVLQTDYQKSSSYLMNKAFWILYYICFELNWREVYKPKLHKLNQMMADLDKKIAKVLPDIAAHMKFFNLNSIICFLEYFVSILMATSELPLKKRILDLFLLEGEKLIHSMIIRFLALNKKEILEINDSFELQEFLKRQMIPYCYKKQQQEIQTLFPMPQNEIIQQQTQQINQQQPQQPQLFCPEN